jgi:7-cyano-7-deazaguanine synthase
MICPTGSSIGVLSSGGLDSSILIAHLLAEGHRVQPFYIRAGLYWENCELAALRNFLAALARPGLAPLVTLELPLGDLYGDHWSITGRDVPGAETADDAVFLPGRNALLVMKAALWCQMHAIPSLALGTLGSNPFADATPDFFAELESALNRGPGPKVRLVRPFASFDKRRVMEVGRGLPLAQTFSCIVPQAALHCGQCNKCAERQAAFGLVDSPDPTAYAAR